ncbi:MAG: deoxyribodipyrimidine photo-lyase [Hydrogenovibrio sp.]|uniref:cryptochrome/photolyase family protein n=1 Tax=Hydrogenovibrio sp. TaxID=2065821 RepID=UPI00286FC4F2|nr:deoxyribodipyrimidine photo-lyase [Hydrogenovibrio sp.]MDR9498795.1 deoxyribodipyrimidine photo-lyase [Hydrogenovibrio sp.]
MTTLVWLQRELRTQHHPALASALARARRNRSKVIVAYFHDPAQTIGSANNAWLAQALPQLQQDLRERGGDLWLIEGDFATQLQNLIEQHAIQELFYTYQPGSPFDAMQRQAESVCRRTRTALTPFETENWLPYARLHNQSHKPYKVYTPFFKSLQSRFDELEPLDSPAPEDFAFCLPAPKGLDQRPGSLEAILAQPWAQNILRHWQVGEIAAWQQWQAFQQQGLPHYSDQRDFPAIHGTSGLSAALHFGHLHSRALLFALLESQKKQGTNKTQQNASQQVWMSQLAWREFARSILWHFPESEHRAFQPKFEDFYPRLETLSDADHKNYQAWCQGQTGVPLIDAGMRQLWQTGWMHNRVRMVAASWLTKNAHIHWLDGAAWFADTLVDADPANNTMGWQWVAGSGVDASPYYRLFNPIRQSERFDPQGDYIARWVPELANLPSKQRLVPHADQPDLLQTALDYPPPRMDLVASRQQHLHRVEQLKKWKPIV